MELTNEQKTKKAYNQNVDRISRELLACGMMLGAMDHIVTEEADIARVGVRMTSSGLLQVVRQTNPINWLAYEPSERLFIDIHEWWHPTLFHFMRRKGRDPIIWNIACDCEINPMVTHIYSRPVDALMPEHFRLTQNLTAEQMYEKLMKNSSPDIDKLPLSDELKEAMKAAQKSSSHPYGAFLPMYKERIEQEKEGKFIEQHQGEKLRELLKSGNKMISNMFGSMPGQLEEIVRGYIFSETNYSFEEFNNEFGKYHKVTSTKRKNKWGLPWGKISEETRNLWVVIDTSASVSDLSIKKIVGEIEQIFASDVDNKITVFCVDTEICSVQPFEDIELQSLKISGRGGTDFFGIYEAAKTLEVKNLNLKLDEQPDGIIYLTDGYAQAPDEEEIETLWVIVQDPSHKVKPTKKSGGAIDWGKYIYRD